MSWHRIDENTYIDETLVTCAEYQLFIDEMRQQGKYYQPDHWTSYQYPEGQGREPILGARHADAVEFCNWLTRQEMGKEKYRLPTKQEANGFPMKIIATGPLGYWTERNQFEWVAPIFGNLPDLDIESIRDRVRARVVARGVSRASNRPHSIPLSRDLPLTRSRARDLKRASALDPVFNLVLDQASTNPHALDISLDLTHTRNLHIDLNRTLNLALDRSNNPERIKLLSHAHDRAIDLALDLDRDIHRDRAIALFIDLFNLQERIAGRSPAFEGIRLVKEQIR